MMSKKLVGLALVVPTLLIGGAAIASTTAVGAGSNTCAVSIDRTQASTRVTRQVMRNGGCVCYIYATPASKDSVIAAMARGGCGASGFAAAAAQADAGTAPADATAADASAGGISHGAAIGLGVAGIAALGGGIYAIAHKSDSKGG